MDRHTAGEISESWERMQRNYMADREGRFRLTLDYLAAVRGEAGLHILVVGARPASLVRRLVERFPDGRINAMEQDPVHLEICRSCGDTERVEWIQAEPGSTAWAARLAPASLDAIVSMTAFHWYSAGKISDLYEIAAGLLKPKGLLINDHHMPFSRGALRDVGTRLHEEWQAQQLAAAPADCWEGFWEAAGQEPDLAPLFAQRQSLGNPQVADQWPSVHFHIEALRAAGFAEVTEAWRHLDDALIVARR
jgi:hypothetical protein